MRSIWYEDSFASCLLVPPLASFDGLALASFEELTLAAHLPMAPPCLLFDVGRV